MSRSVQRGHGELLICRDYDELSRTAAERFIVAANNAVRERGRFMGALSGGKTPVGMYRLLAGEMRERVPRDRAYLFWSDERCVPPDDPESNYGLAERELLRRIPVPPERIFRMRGELEPQRAAADYERALRSAFQLAPAELPRFDLLLLGMGDEGHTASLFPGSEALKETQKLVAAPFVPKVKMYRLTLTLPVINAARAVVVLVSGEKKSRALAQAVAGGDELPAQLVRPTDGTLTWIADRDAAKSVEL
jgi:6-phosphogluconolactonase